MKGPTFEIVFELIKKGWVMDIAKSIGVKLGVMDEATKKKYEGMHKELKEIYDEEYKEWFEDGGEEAVKRAKKDKKW